MKLVPQSFLRVLSVDEFRALLIMSESLSAMSPHPGSDAESSVFFGGRSTAPCGVSRFTPVAQSTQRSCNYDVVDVDMFICDNALQPQEKRCSDVRVLDPCGNQVKSLLVKSADKKTASRARLSEKTCSGKKKLVVATAGVKRPRSIEDYLLRR